MGTIRATKRKVVERLSKKLLELSTWVTWWRPT
jgi:hypothetical protein